MKLPIPRNWVTEIPSGPSESELFTPEEVLQMAQLKINPFRRY